MTEETIVRPFTMDALRLSGSVMNDYYYFGTGPTSAGLPSVETVRLWVKLNQANIIEGQPHCQPHLQKEK